MHNNYDNEYTYVPIDKFATVLLKIKQALNIVYTKQQQQ